MPADPASLLATTRWLAETTLAGASEAALIEGLCARLQDLGLGLSRATIGIDTLHPVVGARGFYWRRGGAVVPREFDRSDAEVDERWTQSPHYHLLQSGERWLRHRIDPGAAPPRRFPVLDDLAAAGATDYVAFLSRFGETATIGEMDAVYSSWISDRDGGFGDADVAALEAVVPYLAAAIRQMTVARIAETLVETYLGRDAGRRVLKGAIARGTADKIRAVLWFSDLKGFTRLVDTQPPQSIIPLLNDYADILVSAVHGQGGQVLKFIGDGLLATFATGDSIEDCRRGLAAAEDAFARVAALNARRAAGGRATTGFYLALHVGDVFYGNIGSDDRLDFTVIGPAVNEVTRINGMCRSLEQDLVLSSAFAGAAGPVRSRLCGLGRYALRGVARPQELFTLERGE
jgi:adenylate cyclase